MQRKQCLLGRLRFTRFKTGQQVRLESLIQFLGAFNQLRGREPAVLLDFDIGRHDPFTGLLGVNWGRNECAGHREYAGKNKQSHLSSGRIIDRSVWGRALSPIAGRKIRLIQRVTTLEWPAMIVK